MAEENIVTKTRRALPEGVWRFLIIAFILYSFFIVGKIIYENYGQNKQIEKQRDEINNLKAEIAGKQLNIIYYKTATYKEKIARAKLRYALPGETVVATPYDETKERLIKEDASPVVISRPNYEYWRIFFFNQ